MSAVPKEICQICGEFLPHACAPIIIITRPKWDGSRRVEIIDR